jgi:hypothetical protein
MLWRSTLNSAAAFTKAVTRDPDFVFVTRVDNPISLTVSGASEQDANMVVIGPYGAWRVNLNREGRQLAAIRIKLPKRKQCRMSFRPK